MKIDFQPEPAAYDEAWNEQKLCFTQHRAWGEVKSGSYEPHFLLADSVAAAVLTRPLPVVRGRYGYAPRVFSQDTLPDAVSLARLASDICKKYRLSHLVIEPNVVERGADQIDRYLSAGFVVNEETVQPRHSRLIDLKQSDEELKADMTKDVRRRVARGENEGYAFSEKTNEAGLDEFYRGLSEVAKRAKFGIQPKSYFARILESFPERMVHIYFCHSPDGEPLYALFALSDNGIFRRIYGGPTLAGRAGDAAQFTAWQAIKAAQTLGCHVLDLWGVAPYDAEDNFASDHPLSGVSKFKATLGGENVTYLPQLIWVRDRARFTAYRQLTRAYRGMKRIKRVLG